MTTAAAYQTLNKIATICVGGLVVRVNVLDHKQAWGKERWLVEPVEGAGQIWVEAIHNAE